MGKQVKSYRIKTLIGQGISGKVYSTYNPEVVVKIIQLKHQHQAISEIYFLNLLKSQSICNLLQIKKTNKDICLYLENGGKKLTQLIPNLKNQQKIKCLSDIAECYKIFDQKEIAHRDLKPDNILMDEKGKVRIIDLGLCEKSQQRYGTHGFMPDQEYQRKWSMNDVYAYGRIIQKFMKDQFICSQLIALKNSCLKQLNQRIEWKQIFKFWNQYQFQQVSQNQIEEQAKILYNQQ